MYQILDLVDILIEENQFSYIKIEYLDVVRKSYFITNKKVESPDPTERKNRTYSFIESSLLGDQWIINRSMKMNKKIILEEIAKIDHLVLYIEADYPGELRKTPVYMSFVQ